MKHDKKSPKWEKKIDAQAMKMLRAYLDSMSEMSAENNAKVFGLIEDGYLKRMTDEGYSHAVRSFVSENPDEKQQKDFFFIMVKQIILQDNLREVLNGLR